MSMESPLEVLSRAASFVERSPPERSGDPEDADRRTQAAGGKELPTKARKQERMKERGASLNEKKNSATQTFSPAPPMPFFPPMFTSYMFASPYLMSSAAAAAAAAAVAASPPPPPPPVIPSPPVPSPPVRVTEDADIEEHFRRSLGKDYAKVATKGASKATAHYAEDPCSVDQHFAKSLGQTWRRMQNSSSPEEMRDLLAPASVDEHFARALGGDTWGRIKQDMRDQS